MKTLVLAVVLTLSSTLALAADPAAGPRAREACKADVAALCPGVQTGEGRVAACMKEHAAQLSDGCKTAMAQVHAHRQPAGAPPQ